MGEAKRRASGAFDHKVRASNAEMGPIIETRDDFLDALLAGLDGKLPTACCERHRLQQIHASVLTTAFMNIAAGLANRFGGVRGDAIEHAVRAIMRETIGPGLPAFDRREGRCDG